VLDAHPHVLPAHPACPHLVDLVDGDDAPLGEPDISIGVLEQPVEQALHVLTHVPRLGQRGGISDDQGDVQNKEAGLRKVRLGGC
jgi:hypothetical protein